METGMAATLVAAALVVGLLVGRWWGRVEMMTWLTVLLVHQPEKTAKMLAGVYRTHRAKRARGVL